MDLSVELMKNADWTLINKKENKLNTVVSSSGSYDTVYWLAYEGFHTYIKNIFLTACIL